MTYRSRDKGEPQDWISHHNGSLATAMDLAAWKQLRSGWPIDLLGGQKRPDGFKRLQIDGDLYSRGLEHYVQKVEIGYCVADDKSDKRGSSAPSEPAY